MYTTQVGMAQYTIYVYGLNRVEFTLQKKEYDVTREYYLDKYTDSIAEGVKFEHVNL